MSLFQELERVLDHANVKINDVSEHCGVELESLNARRLQERSITLAESADFSGDHAADRNRERAFNFCYRTCQAPASACIGDKIRSAQVAQKVDEEEWRSLRPAHDSGCE